MFGCRRAMGAGADLKSFDVDNSYGKKVSVRTLVSDLRSALGWLMQQTIGVPAHGSSHRLMPFCIVPARACVSAMT